MKETALQQRTYAPGHSEHELDRLSLQAEAFELFTRQLFQQAGITTGMRVLDAGCGGGDVAFLAAELVEPSGAIARTKSTIAKDPRFYRITRPIRLRAEEMFSKHFALQGERSGNAL